MKWELYLDQVHGIGNIALAVFVAQIGIFAWWALINWDGIQYFMIHRKKFNTIFWAMVVQAYLLFFILLAFFWPE